MQLDLEQFSFERKLGDLCTMGVVYHVKYEEGMTDEFDVHLLCFTVGKLTAPVDLKTLPQSLFEAVVDMCVADFDLRRRERLKLAFSR